MEESSEYCLIALFCIIQTIRIVLNHHKFCGFQNLLLLFCLCWCFFRVIALFVSFILSILNEIGLLTGNGATTTQLILNDLPSFVMVALLSVLICYFLYLIHHNIWSKHFKFILFTLLILLNVAHILILTVIDVLMIFIDTSLLTYFSLAMSSISYFVLCIGLIYVSIRIYFVKKRTLPNDHPTPLKMGICSTIICVAIIIRCIYDLISTCFGQSLISMICTGDDPIDFCKDSENARIIILIFQICEFTLMTIWEIIPLTSLVVMFWYIPHSKTYNPFPHFNNEDLTDDSSISEYDEIEPLLK
ncbi:THH1/TOM1/TOM3 domain-containing protein [Entamoeba marina]